MTKTTNCPCLACDPKSGEIGLECSKTKTTTDHEEAEALAHMIEQKAIALLHPMFLRMELDGYRPEFKVIMWEAVARKANTYAERIKS